MSPDFDALYRRESRRVLATLIRLLGDFDLAEEAMAEAFRAAMEQWPQEGVPANPRAWLVSAGRFKAIDAIRRQARFSYVDAQALEAAPAEPEAETEGIEDDRLRLVFTCCHPALAQRIVRAKTKIRQARIPYEVPAKAELPERLEAVLRVVYLVYNEGYSASSGDSVTRAELSQEAIRLGRLIVELLPEPEATGLLALMLLQESRRAARSRPDGELVLLEDQDRSLWNRALIAEGIELTTRALGTRRFGPYCLQAAIAAVHAEAPSASETDWSEVIGLYDALSRLDASPVIALNRAVAVAMRDGPAAGLALVDALMGELEGYHLAHAVRADLCRRLARKEEAIVSYERALALSRQEPERRFLGRRIAELEK